MVDEPRKRRVEILWELYQRPQDGRLQVAAMALGRNVDAPVFRLDTGKLFEDGAIVLADMPEFGNLGTPELYRVTSKGAQILREWGYPVEH